MVSDSPARAVPDLQGTNEQTADKMFRLRPAWPGVFLPGWLTHLEALIRHVRACSNSDPPPLPRNPETKSARAPARLADPKLGFRGRPSRLAASRDQIRPKAMFLPST